jgi:hypothetical protein
MTDRDLQQIKEIIRQVIREEKVLETHRWYTLRDYCKLINRKRDAVWRMEKNGSVETRSINGGKEYRTRLL